VGRVLGLAYAEVDKVAKLIPDILGISLAEALAMEPRLRQQMEADPRINKMMELAMALENMPRHVSVHASGVVIGDVPLYEIVPLYKAQKEDAVVTQFDMKGVAKAGLIKFDFLGLNTLTEIDKALKLIRASHDPGFDLGAIPLDDKKTFDLLSRGDSAGVFQVESAGMKALLTQMRPSCLEDIIALVALYRPGPLESGMIEDYVACKHGRKAANYFLPQLKAVLKETHGVMVYQEQVLEIARVVAGYSLGEGDNLRRAMGKKDPEIMAAERGRCVEGAQKRGLEADKAGQLFDLIEKFAGYGFNKSHSACYGLIAYQTAWLKANYPLQFMAAVLSCRSDKQDTVMKLIGACRSQQLKIFPPDLNLSDLDFTVAGDAIRFGLGAVKNVGAGAVEAIVAARQDSPFRSLFDFCARLDSNKINRKVLESLIKCGALDSLHPNRAQLLAAADEALEYGQRLRKERQSAQISMFAQAGLKEPQLPPNISPWPEKEALALEKEALGFYISGHPLNDFVEDIGRLNINRIEDLSALPDKSAVRLAGVCVRAAIKFNKNGERWALVTLEDLLGTVEVMVWAEVFKSCEALLGADDPVLVIGVLEHDERGDKVVAQNIMPLGEAVYYLSHHPLNAFAQDIKRLRVRGSQELSSLPDKSAVRLAGVCTRADIKLNKRGKRYALAVLEDLSGAIDLTIWPEALESCADIIGAQEPVLVSGTLKRDSRGLKVDAQKVMPLKTAAAAMTTGVKISLDAEAIEESGLVALRQTLQAHPGPCRVVLCMSIPGDMEVVMKLDQYRVNPSEEFLSAVEANFGAVTEILLALT
jgi:DNA polymerase-3 subunit alpha